MLDGLRNLTESWYARFVLECGYWSHYEHRSCSSRWLIPVDQHGGEDRRDRVVGRADEVRNRREVWPRIAAEAMKITCSSHARAIPRLLTIPCAYAHSTTCNSIRGGYAVAPVTSFRKRASKADTSISTSSK